MHFLLSETTVVGRNGESDKENEESVDIVLTGDGILRVHAIVTKESNRYEKTKTSIQQCICLCF